MYCRNSIHPATLFAGDSGKENGFLLTFSNTKKMINLFDAIIDRHRREVAASLKAGNFVANLNGLFNAKP